MDIGKVEELTRQGRMRPAGLAAFERRSEERSGTYSHEQEDDPKLDEESEESFPASDPPAYMGSAAIARFPKHEGEPRKDRKREGSAAGKRPTPADDKKRPRR